MQYIKTPKITAFAKIYYKCQSLLGMPLEVENSASTSSHWLKSALFNDIMTINMGKNPAISLITLKFLSDTGWYFVDETKADYFIWGESSTCNFFL